MGDYYNQFYGDCEMIVQKNTIVFLFMFIFLCLCFNYYSTIHHDNQNQIPTL